MFAIIYMNRNLLLISFDSFIESECLNVSEYMCVCVCVPMCMNVCVSVYICVNLCASAYF